MQAYIPGWRVEKTRRRRRLGVEAQCTAQGLSTVTLVSGCVCSVSVVSRATCAETRELVVIKAYDRARMRPKHFARLAREVELMRLLGRTESMARALLLVFVCVSSKCTRPRLKPCALPGMLPPVGPDLQRLGEISGQLLGSVQGLQRVGTAGGNKYH